MTLANFNLPSGIIGIIERNAHRDYYLAKLYYAFLYHFHNLRDKNPLIVYQMGKVGSSTVVRSLRALQLDRPIFHVHTLVEAQRKPIEKKINLSQRQYFKRSKNALISRYLEKEVNRSKKHVNESLNKKWKVITLVRDPIAQNVSSFFQVIDLYILDFLQRYENNKLQIKDLTELFLKQYSPRCSFNNWFDLELKAVFGIDVYASEFPKTRGYEIYSSDWAECLLLRLENLNQCASEAFQKFLGIEDFKLVSANITHDKTYYSAYKDFKSTAELPDSHIDAIYELKQVQHFYTEEEIQAFKAKAKNRRDVN